MKSAATKEIRKRAEEAIRARIFPGCVIGFIKSGEQKIFPFGNLTYEADAPAVLEDTIYDVASVTKSIPTASLALMLIDEGKLKTSDKLIQYVPEFCNSDRENVTIKHLLTYTIQGVQLSTLKDKTPDDILLSAYSRELAHKPGSVFEYTNLPALLLGIAVERVGKNALDKLAQKYFFGPLRMRQTTFFPQSNSNIAPTEIENGEAVIGIMHDESARAFAQVGKTVGHAGLFSTAPDLLRFLGALLHGEYPYISAGAESGLGWEVNQPFFMGKKCGERTFGKTGFTGASCVCDIKQGIAFVILSNRTYPKRPIDRVAIDAFRADIADLLFR